MLQTARGEAVTGARVPPCRPNGRAQPSGMILDPLYLALALPGLLFGLWAQYKVKRAFGHWSQVPISRGLTGAAIAKQILAVNGIRDVRVEPVGGFLSDHYDPRSKTLRLSPDVYEGRSIAAAGIAAHEVGHAIQH